MKTVQVLVGVLLCGALGCGGGSKKSTSGTDGSGGTSATAGSSGKIAGVKQCEGSPPTSDCPQWECVDGKYVCPQVQMSEEVRLGCTYENTFHARGTTFLSSDGCYSCECSMTTTVACTNLGCDAGSSPSTPLEDSGAPPETDAGDPDGG